MFNNILFECNLKADGIKLLTSGLKYVNIGAAPATILQNLIRHWYDETKIGLNLSLHLLQGDAYNTGKDIGTLVHDVLM